MTDIDRTSMTESDTDTAGVERVFPVEDEKSVPCGKFELDLNAKTFNVCKHCQLPKQLHVDFSRASTELRGKLGKRNEINSVSCQKAGEATCCDNFRRDLSGTTFDMCYCGFPKSAHQKKKLTTGAGKELARKLSKKSRVQEDDSRDSEGNPRTSEPFACGSPGSCSVM